jgi:hypothetical protein
VKIKVDDTDAVIVLSQDGTVRCHLPLKDAFKDTANNHTTMAIAITAKLQNDPKWDLGKSDDDDDDDTTP